ncbi:hypothetical protein [Cellulomonas endometrii]|uniref:hypothetical protein n=1 Tax=Cellulomonas endometrii TaxID=3036301 RepID=UPI0024AE8212|nr:hypothetical protein [Cellulomonas endometrii]
MAEPLVVQFRPEARQEFQRRASQDPARRGRAAIALATLLTLLVLAPWIAVNVVQGFEPRSLALLAFLVVPATLVAWGRRKLQDRPAVLGAVAFVVTPDEIQFEALPSANSALADVAADVWPTAETTAEIRPSRVVGDRLVLRRPGARRRVYLAATLDTPAEVISARLTGA